jgi:hypothetical protein
MESNEQESALEPIASDRQARALTPKNRLFLQLLSEGKKTLEAYKQAGYKGNDHAAYQLRSDLKEELVKVLEGQGVDRAGLMQGLKTLIDLPTKEEQEGTIPVKFKLHALNLLFKMVEASKPVSNERPKITAFIVNNGVAKEQPSSSIDTSLSE